jgi:hypothetical protein
MSTSRLTIISRPYSLCGVMLLLTLGACSAATVNQAPVHRHGPDLRGYYGTGTRTPGQMAFGGPTGITHSRTSERPDLDAYLKPSARDKVRPVLARNDATRSKAPASRALPAAPATIVAEQQPLAIQTTPAPTTPAAITSPHDAQRYAAREQQSSKQQQYRGGDVVVISASTILIILLIVILILLLT